MIHRSSSNPCCRRLTLRSFVFSVCLSFTGCLPDKGQIEKVNAEISTLTVEADALEKSVRDLENRRDSLQSEIPPPQPTTPGDVAKAQEQADSVLKGLRKQLAQLDEEIKKWESTPKPDQSVP